MALLYSASARAAPLDSRRCRERRRESVAVPTPDETGTVTSGSVRSVRCTSDSTEASPRSPGSPGRSPLRAHHPPLCHTQERVAGTGVVLVDSLAAEPSRTLSTPATRHMLDHLAAQGAHRVAHLTGPGEKGYARACVTAYTGSDDGTATRRRSYRTPAPALPTRPPTGCSLLPPGSDSVSPRTCSSAPRTRPPVRLMRTSGQRPRSPPAVTTPTERHGLPAAGPRSLPWPPHRPAPASPPRDPPRAQHRLACPGAGLRPGDAVADWPPSVPAVTCAVPCSGRPRYRPRDCLRR